MTRKLIAVLLSVALFSLGWLGLTGLLLPVAFVPLLWLSAEAEASRRGWWQTFGWALLTFVGWNLATIWWIWNATPVGPVAATLFSTFWNMLAFMTFHTVSKRAPKALAYTIFVAVWIAAEYGYMQSDFSWPWLTLGNGFSHDVWAVQWYEWTGVFGGSLWVLVANLAIFEALRMRSVRAVVRAAAVVVVPMTLSLCIWLNYEPQGERTVTVSIVQPNVDCYDKFHGDDQAQIENIFALLEEASPEADYILLPETAMPGYYWEGLLSAYVYPPMPAEVWQRMLDTLSTNHPQAMLVTGANTRRYYQGGAPTRTARRMPYSNDFQDIYNSSVGIDPSGNIQIHHKGKLVIGVESTPTWIFDLMRFLVIDLGGVVGQLGEGKEGTAFRHRDLAIGPAICYEGVYGDYFGSHVRAGAQLMALLSNDGWWGDTPGYKQLFSLSRLRAIEHRRAIARSANTGRSGFISARGDVSGTMEWNERGVLTEEVLLSDHQTLYTRAGDYVARIALYVTLLSLLYYVAYRIKRRNYLVE